MIGKTIRLHVEGNYLCGRLSINEWNAVKSFRTIMHSAYLS